MESSYKDLTQVFRLITVTIADMRLVTLHLFTDSRNNDAINAAGIFMIFMGVFP